MQVAAPISWTEETHRGSSTRPGGPALAVSECYSGTPAHRQAQKRALLRRCLPAGFEGEIELPPRRAPNAPRSGYRLSLAHSGASLVAAASSAGHLGVDVERLKPRDTARLEGFLGWQSPSRCPGHFYRRWTLGEALLKTGWANEAASLRACFAVLDRHTPAGVPVLVDHGGVCFRLAWPDVVSNAVVAVVEVDV